MQKHVDVCYRTPFSNTHAYELYHVAWMDTNMNVGKGLKGDTNGDLWGTERGLDEGVKGSKRSFTLSRVFNSP